jgi:two-component system, OmpR family, sensor histidine kinase PhoQ
MISLSARVNLSAAVVLTIFIALTALALERAFEESATASMRERLYGQLYLLMSAAEVSDSGMLAMPGHLAEARFEQPGSGLYARIGDGQGKTLWQSPSAVGLELPPPPSKGDGLLRLAFNNEQHFLVFVDIEWETMEGSVPLRFSVLQDPSVFNEQMQRYRHNLWGMLGVMAVLLLMVLAGALAWGLRPLRTVAREVRAIESGKQEALQREYPKEIRRLTDNINTLLNHERATQARYKNALGDLAHSLKTPLAVLRGLGDSERSPQIDEQVTRMDNIVQYQLQRAATAGRSALAAAIDAAPVAERLVATLEKVYQEKPITLDKQLDPAAHFRGDEGDLMELLGNLLDNAWKWAAGRIVLRLENDDDALLISVEDDGPGIAAAKAEQVLARGVRLDEATPGHGIGLPMVRDIVEAYAGSLKIERADLGGARIAIRLP